MSTRKVFHIKIGSSLKKGGFAQKFYFTIVGKNGKVIATSEMYSRKQNVVKAIRAILHLTDNGYRKALDITLFNLYIKDLTGTAAKK